MSRDTASRQAVDTVVAPDSVRPGATALTTLRLRPSRPDGAFRRRDEPMCVGLPMPRGRVTDADTIGLAAHGREPAAVQRTVLERWGDGSIRWVLLEFLAQTDDSGSAEYAVMAFAGPAAPPPSTLRIRTEADGITVASRAVTATCRSSGVHLRRAPDGPAECQLTVTIEAAAGHTLEAHFDEIDVERSGPLAAQLRLSARLTRPDSRPLHLVLRIGLHDGSAAVTASVAVHNPSRAAHPGGIWELGDTGSLLFSDLSVRLTRAAGSAGGASVSEEPGAAWIRSTGALRIHQDSSGGPHWDSPAHITRDGTLGVLFPGYELSVDETTRRGRRATPIVTLEGSPALAVTMAHFWENCPKAIDADGTSIALRLFPGRARSVYELQGGERKRHDFAVAIGDAAVAAEALGWARSPLVASAPFEWYRDCAVLPFLTAPGADPPSDALVQAAVDGPEAFSEKRERADEYGWRHYGDLYADHEAVNASGPFVSHYNNQYDPIAGAARQFFRTGDPRWYAVMAPLARHVADIDIYHTQEDKAAYNGGLFWHTFHYVDAGRSTHRSYPSAPTVNGGGPSCEHDYAEGLALHYLLTGDPDSRATVLELANWVVAMDDGRRTPFAWLDRGATGAASATVTPGYHGPGRGAGNSILTLLTAARVSGERSFLDKAEALIARCIHPADDPAAHQLLDAERRWSYTVFLQVLGRYLAHKSDRLEHDAQYAYAFESLLTYARWMARHEVPYLDRPEGLEYPTETWAAQDLRKAEVFVLAWLGTTGAEREQMRERAHFFFDQAVATLAGLPTRALTRPLVLLMAYTGSVPWMRVHPDAAWPAPPPALAASARARRRAPFVPQRERALRRAMVIAGAVGLVIGSVVIWVAA